MHPPTRDEIREGESTTIGGAWHPDSPRIGVPGILSEARCLNAGPGSETDTEMGFKEVT